MKKFISWAGAAAVLFAIVWIAKPKTDPAGEAFAKFYDPKTETLKSMLAGLESFGMAGVPTRADSLAKALKAYDAGQYEQSLALLNALETARPGNDTVGFYLGMNHLGQSRYARAIELLTPVSARTESPLRHEAVWSLALCYLKTPDGTPDAIRLFEGLLPEPAYKKSAEAVLAMLR